MKRVSTVVIKPTDLEERLDFSREVPHTVHLKSFPEEDIVPLHYGETLEILLCDGLAGELVIDGKPYELGGRQVFVIPPLTVHANRIQAGPGQMAVVKVSFPDLAHFMDIPAMLAYQGLSLDRLDPTGPPYDALRAIVDRLIERDDRLFLRMAALIDLFALLSRHMASGEKIAPAVSQAKNDFLTAVLSWTQAQYAQPVSLADIASHIGYSKSHFCHMFRELTGMTWPAYLHSVRVSAACRLLQDGLTVGEAGERCGFANLSHFIRIFRQVRGLTPRAYQQHGGDRPAVRR